MKWKLILASLVALLSLGGLVTVLCITPPKSNATIQVSEDNSVKTELITDLEKLVGNYNQQIKSLQTVNANNDTTITTLNRQITALQQEITTLQTSGTADAAQIADLNAQVVTLQNTVSELQTTNENNNTTITTLNTLVTNLETEIATLENANSLNASEITNLQTTITQLQNDNADLDSEIARLENIIANQCVVTFVCNNQVLDTQIVSKNSCATTPAVTIPENKTFYGWVVNGESIDVNNYLITGNTILTADIGGALPLAYFVESEIEACLYIPQAMNFWFDGEQIHYDYNREHYVIDKSTKQCTRITYSTSGYSGSNEIEGRNIITLEDKIYYIKNSDDVYGQPGFYRYDKANQDWVYEQPLTFSIIFTNNFWSDNTTMYYSYNTMHYKYNRLNQAWERVTFNGKNSFNGNAVWHANGECYLSWFDGVSYKLNKETLTWEEIITIIPYDGFYADPAYVWTDGTDTFFTCGDVQLIFVPERNAWANFTWGTATYPKNTTNPPVIFRDDDTTYYYYSNSYTLYELRKEYPHDEN